MFELLLIACVADRICNYETSPQPYASEAACRRQAALISGMTSGRHAPGHALSYRFQCRGADGPGHWVRVDALGEVTLWTPEDEPAR